jgi:predicted kinase
MQHLPVVGELAECPQDTQFHAEGDVLTHTRMVVEALVQDAGWRTLPADRRAEVFFAVLLHDVGKPGATRLEPDGRLSARGHARRGAILCRQLLWQRRVPFATRERIAALVRHHTAPFHLLEREDPRRDAFLISQTAHCDDLALLARADAAGRACANPADQARMHDAVQLFEELCQEEGCWDGPLVFPSDHARFLYFRGAQQDPTYRPHERFAAEVVVMSGLTGAGKDHWLREHLQDWPVVSLDALRAALGIGPRGDQRPVLGRAHDLAREHLRAGRSFAWNATNLSRQVRGECISFLAAYGPRVRIVYVEAPPDRLRRQNRERASPVPEPVVNRLMERWEVPDLSEAHEVTYAVC